MGTINKSTQQIQADLDEGGAANENIAAAIAAHASAANPHPQYLTSAETTDAISSAIAAIPNATETAGGFMSILDKIKINSQIEDSQKRVSAGFSTLLIPEKILDLDVKIAAIQLALQSAAPVISAETYTAVKHYDPVNGDDFNSGLRKNAPLKTFPAYPSANTMHLIKSGTTVNQATRIDPGANCYIGTYDYHIAGAAIINGAAVTSDPTRAIRIGSANVTIGNVKVIAPVGTANGSRACINITTGATGCRLIGVETDFPSSGYFGFHVTIAAVADFVIEDCRFIGGHCGMNINGAGATLGTTPARIKNNQILLAPTNEAYTGECDGITISSGTAAFDWNYKLIVSENIVSGFWENGIDTNDSKRVIIIKNEFTNQGIPRSSVNICAGMLLGNSGGLDSGYHIVHGNYLHHLEGSGILSRGGKNCIISGNILDTMFQGVLINLASSHYCKVLNNTIVNITTNGTVGGCIRMQDSLNGLELFNNILHGDQYISGFGTSGLDLRHGGNLMVGPYDAVFSEDAARPTLVANSGAAGLVDVFETGTYRPKISILKNPVARLAFSLIDYNLTGYPYPCQGAMAYRD